MNPVTEIAPSARLRPWVDSYWTRPAAAGEAAELIVPDGCADIVFDVEGATAMVVGTMTRPLVLRAARVPAYFGVRFRPGRARAFLRVPLHEITDQHIPFEGSAVAERLANTRTPEHRVALVEAWLQRICADPDRGLEHAVGLLAAGASVDEAARIVGVSRQHLRRRFLEEVGVGPKTFARVARFQRLLQRVREGNAVSWAGAAADLGYFDQSHLIADFRALAGATPVPFFLSP